KRFANRVVLVLDGDQAGQDRANQVLELFVAQDLDLKVLTLPAGADPCDYLQEHGAESFQRLLDNESVDALEHARRVAVRGIDLQNDVHAATAALERVLSILAKAPRQDGVSGFREDKILQRLATEFGVSEVDVRRHLKRLRRATRRPLAAPRGTLTPPGQTQSPQGDMSALEACNSELSAIETDGYEPQEPAEIPFRAANLHNAAPCEYELLEVLIKRPDLLDEIRGRIRNEQITQAPCRRLYETFCRLSDEGLEATFDRLMLEFDSPAMKAFLVELDESERTARIEDVGSLIPRIIRSFERIENQRQDPAQLAALKNQGLDESQKQDLLLKMLGDLRARHGISESTDG
ncbi:MAG: toprim domain-containing protein, partial [Pirellulales bacterium]|nr:toprim domain-containing protein [Pirellulales bacterium]